MEPFLDWHSLPHSWVEDPRTPLLEFSFREQKYGFYFLSIPMWIELIAFIVGHALLAAVFAWILYHVHGVVADNHQSSSSSGRTTSANRRQSKPFLASHGLLALLVWIPFWIWCPKFICSLFHWHNKIFLFCFCVITPNTSIFRISETIFGFTPDYAKASPARFVLYFASPMYLQYDAKHKKFIKASWRNILDHLRNFVGYLFLTGFYQSLFLLLPLFPSFGSGTTPSNWYSWQEIINPQQWKASIFYGVLFQLYLVTFGEGMALLTAFFTGRKGTLLMNNPMFGSQSPSEFWGRRWNSLIHTCLKNGVYKPVRKLGGTKEMAVVAAFVASGLFHEWILPVVIYDHASSLPVGMTSLFFCWQAGLISLEYTIGHWKAITQVVSRLPKPLRTVLVILAGVPLGHFFADGYVNSNFFVQGHVAFPAIRPIPTTQ